MAAMSFDTPKSSMTSHVGYDDKTGVLSLTFRNGGRTHHFTGVPIAHFHGLRNAASVGKYYHAHLRGKFGESR